MTRYARQQDKKSCGPVAICNALKWTGANVTWKKHKHWLRRMCRWSSGSRKERRAKGYCGAIPRFMQTALNCHPYCKKHMIVYEVLNQPTVMDLDKHLRKGGAFILRFIYDNGESLAHYVFCPGKEGKDYIFVNDAEDLCSRKRMKRLLRNVHTSWDGYSTSVVWLLAKREEEGAWLNG